MKKSKYFFGILASCFCLGACSSSNNNPFKPFASSSDFESSYQNYNTSDDGPFSSSPIESSIEESSSYTIDSKVFELEDTFKTLVNYHMTVMDFDEKDKAENLVTITYQDNGSSFDLSILAESVHANVILFDVKQCQYDGFANFMEYLLDPNRSDYLDADNTISLLVFDRNTVLTSKKQYKYLCYRNQLTDHYFSGFYYENNQFYLYQKREFNNEDPFDSEADQIINKDDLLYDFYRYLLAK